MEAKCPNCSCNFITRVVVEKIPTYFNPKTEIKWINETPETMRKKSNTCSHSNPCRKGINMYGNPCSARHPCYKY